MNEEEFNKVVRDMALFMLSVRGEEGLQSAVGVLYGAYLSREFPEWWQRFASSPQIHELLAGAGVDEAEMRQECLDAFIEPRERTMQTWRN